MAVFRRTLSAVDAGAIILGVVIGAGIFKTPSFVAANSGNEEALLIMWAAGGAISLVGALCYAELASTFPHPGGDYFYLQNAFGRMPAFLFAWARMTVIQTGSIAMLGFLVGDYASEVFNLGRHSASCYACAVVLLLTGINIAGIEQGKWMQKTLTFGIVTGLLLVVVVGLLKAPSLPAPLQADFLPGESALGKAMIFVLLTYGGWNEAAYISAEVRDAHRNMARVLLFSIALITAIYLIVNFVLVKSMGLSAMSQSNAVAADLMRGAVGENGARFVSLLVIVAALSTMNATIITGARTNFAMGRDFHLLGFLGRWREREGTPANALLLQGAIALLLILLGTGTRSGFAMMVDFTAPVFWVFFLLVGISLFALRRKAPKVHRPFRVPLYPFTPILFCAVCVYMLQSSVAYTGTGSLIGLGVLAAGTPLLLLDSHRFKKKRSPQFRKERQA